MTKRRNFSDKFKATVALEALRGDKTVQEIAASYRFKASSEAAQKNRKEKPTLTNT